jgi:hypothetical protein
LLCTGGDRTCNRIIGWLDGAGLLRAGRYVMEPPARVLIELATARQQVAAAGEAPMTDSDQEALAVAFLWR